MINSIATYLSQAFTASFNRRRKSLKPGKKSLCLLPNRRWKWKWISSPNPGRCILLLPNRMTLPPRKRTHNREQRLWSRLWVLDFNGCKCNCAIVYFFSRAPKKYSKLILAHYKSYIFAFQVERAKTTQTKAVKVRPTKAPRQEESEGEDEIVDTSYFPGSIKMPLRSVSEENSLRQVCHKDDKTVLREIAGCMYYMPRTYRKQNYMMRRVKDAAMEVSQNTKILEVSSFQ